MSLVWLLPFFSTAQTKPLVKDCTVTHGSRTYFEMYSTGYSTTVDYSGGKPIYSFGISNRSVGRVDSTVTHWSYDLNGREVYALSISTNDSLPNDTVTSHYTYGSDGRLLQIIRTTAHHSIYYTEVQRGADTTQYFDKMIVERGWRIFEDGSLSGMARVDTTEFYDKEQRVKRRQVMYTERGLERAGDYSYVYSDYGALMETVQLDTIMLSPRSTLITRWAYHNSDTFAIYYLSFSGPDSANLFESIGTHDSSYHRFVQRRFINRQFADSTVTITDSMGNVIVNQRYDRNGTLVFDSRTYYSVSKNKSEQWTFLNQQYKEQPQYYSRIDTVYSGKGYAVIWSSAAYNGSATNLKSVPRRKCDVQQRNSYDLQGRMVLSEQFREGKPVYKMTWKYSR